MNSKQPDWHAPDERLQHIVAVANRAGSSFSITVLVNGAWLSGMIVGGNEYLKELGVTIADTIERYSEKPADNVREVYHALADDLYPMDTDEDPRVGSVGYLHLKEVQVQSSLGVAGATFQSDFPYFRIRLTVIDGWTLGRVQPP